MKIVLAFVASLNLAVAFQAVPTSRPVLTLQMGMLDDMFGKPSKKQVEDVQPVAQKTRRFKKTGTALWLDKFFSHPMHGHGTDEHSLDDMYDAQQQVLQERRKLFGNGHDAMQKKYSNPSVDHLRDIPTHEHNPAMLNKAEDDAMYIDEGDTGFSFPSFGAKFRP